MRRTTISILIGCLLLLALPAQADDTSVYSGSPAGTVLAISSRRCVFSSIQFLNTTAAVGYLQIFNLPAASVTIGTTAPVASFGVPASGSVFVSFPNGGWIVGGSGCSVAGTTSRAGSTGAAQDTNIVYSERQ